MPNPQGSVQGLCTAGATGFALSVALLGYWGFQGSGEWGIHDMFVLVPLMSASVAFALTPFVATRDDASSNTARWFYLTGVVLFPIAVVAAVVTGLSKH